MTASPVDVYRRQIERELQAGNATEHINGSAADVALASGRHRSQRDAGATVGGGAADVALASGRQWNQRDAGATQGISIRSRGHLPHWEREGATYFVTFRLADSLPQGALDSIEFERKDIVKTAEHERRELTSAEQDRLDKLFSERIESYLDSGHGACHLARTEIAELLEAALRHFDGTRYRLLAWCVMPNHVHVVLRPAPDYGLAGILHSWKSFTAKQANKILKTRGEFWQREYYDHLIRDEQDFDRIVRYVMENPAKTGMKGWKWVWPSAAYLAPPM